MHRKNTILGGKLLRFQADGPYQDPNQPAPWTGILEVVFPRYQNSFQSKTSLQTQVYLYHTCTYPSASKKPYQASNVKKKKKKSCWSKPWSLIPIDKNGYFLLSHFLNMIATQVYLYRKKKVTTTIILKQ